MNKLEVYIKSQINIEEGELNIILSNFIETKIAKDKFVLKQGHLATNYYFIISGGLRIYFDQNDRQITSWIALENEFFTDLASIKNKTLSRFNFQAIEETVLLTIKADKMEQLYKQFPSWQQFGRQIWEINFLKLVEGVIGFQTFSAEERYLTAMQESEFLQRVPLKHLASFLGVTPSSLSRLRKSIK